jgi:hypothetical protein
VDTLETMRPQTSLDQVVYTPAEARQIIELRRRGIKPVQGGGPMTSARALKKATTTTTTLGTDALLDPERSRRLFRTLQEKANFPLRQEGRTASSGEINKIVSSARVIRRGVENDDDGYRAEPDFATITYQTVKIRLPWEITEDALHENIEGSGLEATIESEMTDAWARDLEDLAFNGDTAAGAGPDQAFLQIDDGWLKQIAASADAHNIDGAAINAGVLTKAHFFAAAAAMPNKYRLQGQLRWVMSPNRYLEWVEYRTDRNTAAGDAALGSGDASTDKPLGYGITQVPFMPDSVVLLTNPKNLARVVSWAVRRRKVDGSTDWELAIKDKRGYVFFVKADHIVDEFDAVVRVHGLV